MEDNGCLKSIIQVVAFWIGMFIGAAIIKHAVAAIAGGIIAVVVVNNLWKSYEEDKARERREREQRIQESQRLRWAEEARERKRKEAIELARKYPEATKHYFSKFWGINKSTIYDLDITCDRAEKLLSCKYSYEEDEIKFNPVFRAKVEAKKEEEKRNLVNTLPACVSSWISHSSSTLKHKYFYDYYTYAVYKDNATSSMWNTWRTVWHFKNDPDKNVSSYEHDSAFQTVTRLVENELRSTFGSKTEYLTLVCLTASTQRKTELRFKDFAEKVCNDLNMTNAYSHIRVVEDGGARHDGGDGCRTVSHDRYFFNGKYVVLFDDVRTTGRSLEQERRILESLGAKVICAITIAQTTH